MIWRVARVAVTLVAVVALAGCVRFTSVNSFSPDNTVSQDTILALNADAAAQLGVDLNDLTAASLLGAGAEAFPGVDPSKILVEDYVEGDRKGVHIIARDLTLDEFNAAAAGGASSIASGLSTPMTVTRDGDTYVVTIPADSARDLSQVQGGSSIGLISNSIDFSITLEFPGPVISATAGQAEGKKVVLGIEDLFTPDAIVIKGQAADGIAWGPILRWVGIGAIAVVIIGGAALLIWQDKRKQRLNNLPPIDEAAGAGADDEPGSSPGVA